MEKEEERNSKKGNNSGIINSDLDEENSSSSRQNEENSTSIIQSDLDEESSSTRANSISSSQKKHISEKHINEQNEIAWKIIDKYFVDNPNNLVAHHLDSYNHFFEYGLQKIFNENNPIRFTEQPLDNTNKNVKKCFLYLGGKDGSKIYIGKPIIYDENHVHYMYPNEARLRNMTYGATIHYDVDIDFIYYDSENKEVKHSTEIKNAYLGRFPIMLQSNLCILKSLDKNVRFNMGECRNDYGGYFIIDGKEKLIVSQEKFADNMIYVRKGAKNDIYSFSADVRSVSENTSKPLRTTSIKIMAPSASMTNNQIVVAVPNVRKPVPLFILMRALGVISDKDIIQTCLLDLEKNKNYIDYFIPSVHDANVFFNQLTAIEYIATFTKKGTTFSVMEILSDYFLPHIGDLNFLEKAYFVGHMVFKLLKVFLGQEPPTDRDNYRFKRVELSGSLFNDIFREYYLIQKRSMTQKIDKKFYFNRSSYENTNFFDLIDHANIFKEREVEAGLRKAFKGNWGSQPNTKRLGIVQDLNRLSYYSFLSHLRKVDLQLDPTSKVVGPRLLNSSQWGLIDPIDTPDGGNIGIHKHFSISTNVTIAYSSKKIIEYIKTNFKNFKPLLQCKQEFLSKHTKIFVNGIWIGALDTPIEFVQRMKMYRRNGMIPVFTSISFDFKTNEVYIYTDGGRLTRPVYYMEEHTNKLRVNHTKIRSLLEKNELSWQQIVTGLTTKPDDFDYKKNKFYEDEHYEKDYEKMNHFKENASVVDYLDTSEEESSLIAFDTETMNMDTTKKYTHAEIHPSLILGVMGNLIIYPEHNPITRNSFSCGQSRQAVSMYSTNYATRIDKMGVVLNYGEIPLIKSRYLEYINNEENPYGVNAIVAIMSYTGYNVEDAILINEGSVKRGMFHTTYYSMYEAREESSKVSGTLDSKFGNIEKNNVSKIKPGYDYSLLDDNGLVKEGTELDDSIVLIGKMIADPLNKDKFLDDSIKAKKGQLGIVDKSFITDGEDGFNIAKVRIREERMPAIGDKMASRAGQKGTIGLIIPEEDMPFTDDGLKPDLIINPHAIPSRMTLGQIIESTFGKLCATYGMFGDCTAFQMKGLQNSLYEEQLIEAGFNSTGNQVLYNGMNGKQIVADIYIGPTYYLRLKHMVKDKINYRASGPLTSLTRQAVQGRANDGGLRIGEMERDGLLGHGMSAFLKDSFLNRGDDYYIAVCNKTGAIAIYNEAINLFLSPFADGPIQFHTNPDNSMNIKNISQFGRSFSILRVPYTFKLLIQELQCLNIQMRLITDDNVDNLLSMSYSNNIQCLLNLDKDASENEVMAEIQKIININNNLPQPTKIIADMKQQQPYLLESISSNNSQNNGPENTGPESIFQNVLNNENKEPDNVWTVNPNEFEESEDQDQESSPPYALLEPRSPSFSPPPPPPPTDEVTYELRGNPGIYYKFNKKTNTIINTNSRIIESTKYKGKYYYVNEDGTTIWLNPLQDKQIDKDNSMTGGRRIPENDHPITSVTANSVNIFNNNILSTPPCSPTNDNQYFQPILEEPAISEKKDWKIHVIPEINNKKHASLKRSVLDVDEEEEDEDSESKKDEDKDNNSTKRKITII
jgi:DNA-directed RNA polymerase II subunit RPB2